MKTLFIAFLLIPIFSVAQDKKEVFIKMEIKPVDIKKGQTFEIYKNGDEIKIVYKKIDSVKKFSFTDEDKKIVSRLIAKADIDSMTKDSLDYYQLKLDAIKESNTFYNPDSVYIYKTTHKSYFKFLEDFTKMPDSILVNPQGSERIIENTYCFFTIAEDKQKRAFYIESLDVKRYPILTKLINDTEVIIRSFKTVRERKN